MFRDFDVDGTIGGIAAASGGGGLLYHLLHNSLDILALLTNIALGIGGLVLIWHRIRLVRAQERRNKDV